MKTCAVLLRGINVGGHGTLPTKDLRAILERLGLQNVKTYLQSGNAVFRCNAGDRRGLSRKIGIAINKSHQFTPEVFIISIEELQSAIDSNPFPEGEADPKSLHVAFLSSPPDSPDLEKLESLRSATERFELIGAVFYLHAPGGIGRSKLAAKVESALGVALTARNWRSVNAVLSMAREMEA
jgi:uncharacterized protein (DUF1697 family)